jgi:hypothetical protein
MSATNYEYIYVKWITRNGKRVFASSYGLQAFRIRVKKRK